MTNPAAAVHPFLLFMVSVFRLNDHLIEFGNLVAPLAGLPGTRWQVISVIELNRDALTAPQISERLGMTRQGGQKLLNSLMEEGLVEQLPNPRHERSYLYAATGQGKKAFHEVRSLFESWFQEITADITPETIDNARSMLEAVSKNVERVVIHKNGKAALLPKKQAIIRSNVKKSS